jgi:aryl-alcohol dehydrogenase-like predicted oxidoreductase
VQNEFNLLSTADADELIPYCAENGLRYTAFSPLAGGLLTGKYRLGEKPPPGTRLAHAADLYSAYLNEESFAAIEQLRVVVDARGESVAEAALRFVLDTPGVGGLIVAPRRIEHFDSYGFAARATT